MVVDDLLSETLFTLNEREIDARQYLLERHGIQVGDEQYTLSLRRLDASLAGDPFNVSARWIDKAVGDLAGINNPSSQAITKPAAIMAAVRIVEWCGALKDRIERLSKDGRVVSLGEGLQLARALACVEVMHHALGLGASGPNAAWPARSPRHEPADGEDRLVLRQVLTILNGPDRGHYRWDTPARKGRIKVQKLAKKVALNTGIKPQAALRHVSELLRRRKV